MRYDANGIRVSRTDDAGAEYYYYIDGQMILGKKSNGNSLTYLYAGDEVIGAVTGTSRFDYLQDIQDSTIAVLAGDGSVAAAYDYTDFGETTELVSDSTGNEVCYTGGIYDKATGEYYLNARYYDPYTANFLSQDTYRGDEKDYRQWDLYAYCANDPVNYVDPSGEYPLTLPFVMGIVIAPEIAIGASVVVAGLIVGGVIYKKLRAQRPKGNRYGIRIKIHKPDPYHGISGTPGMIKRWNSMKGQKKTKIKKFALHHRWRYHIHIYLTKNGRIYKTLLTI